MRRFLATDLVKMSHSYKPIKKTRVTGKGGYFVVESDGGFYLETRIYDPKEILRMGFKKVPEIGETVEMEFV